MNCIICNKSLKCFKSLCNDCRENYFSFPFKENCTTAPLNSKTINSIRDYVASDDSTSEQKGYKVEFVPGLLIPNQIALKEKVDKLVAPLLNNSKGE